MSLHEGQMDKREPRQQPASRQEAPSIGQGNPQDDLRQAHNLGGVGQGSVTTQGESAPHNMSRHQVNPRNKSPKNKGHRE